MTTREKIEELLEASSITVAFLTVVIIQNI